VIEGYDIEVKLLGVTGLVRDLSHEPGVAENQGSEELIEYSGRLCWGTTEKLGTNPDRLKSWIRMGHESVIEHASATFYIKASRVLTHELVRHRLASYSQRSQRYVKESEPRYITPPELEAGGKGAVELYENAILNSWKAYRKLLADGIKPEIARYVLPNSCETQIVMTMNFRELRHFIKLRTSKRSLPEMRAVAREILNIMKGQALSIFADL
jgi:thymidylate synthase (FAD)